VSWPSKKYPTATIDFRALSYLGQLPLVGVDVHVCAALDCGSLGKPTTTDSSGLAQVTFSNENPVGTSVTLGLNGYLQVEPGDAGANMFPYLFYWGFPVSESAWHSNFPLLSPETFQTAVSSVPVTPPVSVDPSKGHVMALVYDCIGSPAPNVTVMLENQAGATETDDNGAPNVPTGLAGFVFFDNVTPGANVVTATPKDLGTPSSKVPISVLPGHITAVFMFPTPL
jgi:hypothetical protein